MLVKDTTIKRLYLIRHGETDANAAGIMQGRGINPPLSEKGRRQAEALGARFKDSTEMPIDLIVVSSLQRTRETAMSIHQHHPQAEILEFKDLDEISWGVFEGGPMHSDVKALWAKWIAGDFHAKAPEGESPLQVELRAVPVIYSILQSRPEKNIAFVVHGRLIRILLASILDQNLTSMNRYTHHNTCINTLDVMLLPESDTRTKSEIQLAQTAFRQSGASLADLIPSDSLESLIEKGTVGQTPATVTSMSQQDVCFVNRPDHIAFRIVSLDDHAHILGLEKDQCETVA